MNSKLIDGTEIEIISDDQAGPNSRLKLNSNCLWIRIVNDKRWYRWNDDKSITRALDYIQYQTKEELMEKLLDNEPKISVKRETLYED